MCQSEHLVKLGCVFTVGNGRKTLLWKDAWHKGTSLDLHFPELYQAVTKPLATIADTWKSGTQKI